MTRLRGEDALDRWTWAHVATGFGLGFLGVKLGWASALLIGFEALEGVLRQFKVEEGGLFEYESWKNILADVLVGIAAYAAVRPFVPARARVIANL